MSELTPRQRRLREQFEGLIAAAAPFLDVVLGVGERISRIVEPEDHEYYPVRSGGEPIALRDRAGEAAADPERDHHGPGASSTR
jgi:hypothetical protein